MVRIIFLILIFLGHLSVSAQDVSADEAKKYNTPPKYEVKSIANKAIKFNELFIKNKATVILFFSPDCDHCIEELENIKKDQQNLQYINFVMVSNRPLSLLKPFAKQHQLHDNKNINIYSDQENHIARYYGIGSYPSMIVYDQHHNATKKYVSMLVNTYGIFKAAFPNSN